MISNLSSLASPVVFPVEPVVPGVQQAILPLLGGTARETGEPPNEGSAGSTIDGDRRSHQFHLLFRMAGAESRSSTGSTSSTA